MILGVSEKKDMSEACARFISWTQFRPLGLFRPLNTKQNLSNIFEAKIIYNSIYKIHSNRLILTKNPKEI